MIAVRRAVLEDLPAVLGFCQESEYAPRWSEDAWKRSVLGVMLVAEDDAMAICGVVVAADLLGVMTIDNLVVRERMQRQGIARRLIEALAAEARLRDVAMFELEVNERNVAAIALYRALGFAEQGRRKRYYGGVDDAVLMGLQLRDLAGR